MMKRVFGCLCLACMILIVSSCSSSKKLVGSGLVDGMTETEYVESVIAHTSTWSALTAKMTLALNLDGKGETKVGGTLRIKKNEVIQMSITPFLGIEVARVELSSDGVLVIDRMNKRYVQVSFGELKSLANLDWDFHLLQSLFLNELFLPGKGDLTSRDANAFRLVQNQSEVWLEAKKEKRFRYRFLTLAPRGLVARTSIDMSGTVYGLDWNYADFRTLEGKQFPTDMSILFRGGKKPAIATLKLSRLGTDADWEAQTEVSKKYERVQLADLIKILLKK